MITKRVFTLFPRLRRVTVQQTKSHGHSSKEYPPVGPLHPSLRPAHMDELRVPKIPWEEGKAKLNARWNKQLIASIIFAVPSLILYWKLENLNWHYPELPPEGIQDYKAYEE